jgi:dTDP-N-acetylfucosamine:lipid II N-acetylfucosaminyltransferase
MNRYLHVIPNGPFSLIMSKLIIDNKMNNHTIMIPGRGFKFSHPRAENILVYKNHINTLFRFIRLSFRYDTVVFHGFWYQSLIFLSLLLPNVSSKIVWVIWGNDVYNDLSFADFILKKKLAKRIRLISSHVRKDYEYALLKFKLSNIDYKWHSYNIIDKSFKLSLPKVNSLQITLLLSHSGDQRNKHKYQIDLLKEHVKDHFITAYLPLAYGDKEYIEYIKDYSEKTKSSLIQFEIITEFMKQDDYNKFLTNVDIAIFPSDRQIGLANIIVLLAYGKKIYLSKNSSTWDYLSSIGVKVYDISLFDNSFYDYDIEDLLNNRKVILRKYGVKNIINAWENL